MMATFGERTSTVRVDGLNELVRGFQLANKDIKEDLRDALQEAAQPVRADAQRLAPYVIKNMPQGDPWSRMRVGMTGVGKGSVVYVAPVERGVKVRGRQRFRRPKFAAKLLEPMEAALVGNRRRVIARMDKMLGEVQRVWERA